MLGRMGISAVCAAFSSSLLSFIAALLSIEFYLSLSLSLFVCVSSATEKEWNSLSCAVCMWLNTRMNELMHLMCGYSEKKEREK